MVAPKVFVDFHNAAPQSCLRLNCIGTVRDLGAQNVRLERGLRLRLYSEDLATEGVVEYSAEESIWVAVIDWQALTASSNQRGELVARHAPTD